MSGILTVAAGVLLAAYLYRNLQDPSFRRHLFLWWVIIPLMLVAALFVFSAAQAANYSPYQIYKGKFWQTYAIVSDAGNPMCVIRASNSNSAFYIKWTPEGMGIQVWKQSWRLPEGTEVPLQVEFFDTARPNNVLTYGASAAIARKATDGVGMLVTIRVTKEDMANLLKMFGDADKIVVSFPQGDEPSWNIKMEGSRQAANALVQCAGIIQEATSTQPVKPPATQPVKKQPAKDDGGI